MLLVEDNQTISENLVDALEEMVDAKIAHVAAGEQDARDWLSANHEWAVAVVDLFLKEGSGLGVLRAMKERRPSQRVVVLSNYATAEMRTQCLKLGADQVFDKSTELDQFIEYCLLQRELGGLAGLEAKSFLARAPPHRAPNCTVVLGSGERPECVRITDPAQLGAKKGINSTDPEVPVSSMGLHCQPPGGSREIMEALPEAVPREPVHTRAITTRGYLRNDGLWDLEAELIDTKSYPTLTNGDRFRPVGEPIHRMQIRLTIDDEFNVREAVAAMRNTPFAECPPAAEPFTGLVGGRIGPGWRKRVEAAMGGVRGCTHLRELLGVMATVAFQTVPGYRRHQRRLCGETSPPSSQPDHQMGKCLSWDFDGPVIARIAPQFIGYRNRESTR